MSETKTTLHRIDAISRRVAEQHTDQLQVINLSDGTLRIRTPHGAVEVSIDHDGQRVGDDLKIGPATVVRLISARPSTVAMVPGARSLFLHLTNDEAEPTDAGYVLEPAITRDECTLISVREVLFEIHEHASASDEIKRLVGSALSDLDGDTTA